MLIHEKAMAKQAAEETVGAGKVHLVLQNADGGNGHDRDYFLSGCEGHRKPYLGCNVQRQECGRPGQRGYHRWTEVAAKQRTIGVLLMSDWGDSEFDVVVLEELHDQKVIARPCVPEQTAGGLFVAFEIEVVWA